MATTVLATWLIASQAKSRRNISFWCYLISNVLWVAWGIHDHALALIALQFALATLNIRGLFKTEH